MSASEKPKPTHTPSNAAHRIHGLLQTMRIIQQHEEHFCSLMHAIERTGRLSARDARELHALLDQMPGETLLQDLLSIRNALPDRTAALHREEAAPSHAH